MPRFTPPYAQSPGRRGRLRALFDLPVTYVRNRRSMLSVLTAKAYAIKFAKVRGVGEDIHVPVEPDLWKQVLTADAEKFPKSRVLYDILHLLIGDSILVSNGETWKRQRRITTPAFEAGAVKAAFVHMRGAAEAMIARMDGLGANADIDGEMMHATADIIFRAIFTDPIPGETVRRFSKALSFCQEKGFAEGVDRFSGIPSWLTVLRRRALKRAVKDVRGVLDGLVKARFDAHESGRPGGHEDMLQSLIATADPLTGGRFSFGEVCEQVAVLFLAGHETSATVLSWALYLLAMDQEVQERLGREAVDVFGGRRPELADLRKLRLARNVFQETLRLYPPVAFLARTAAETCPIGPHVVPAGQSVMVSPWLIQRNRRLWPEPHVFDPDRFDRPETQQCQRDAYLPFGRGPRVCLGAAFAVQEATLLLAMLARRYRFTPEPGFVPQPIARATVRSANGIRLTVSRR